MMANKDVLHALLREDLASFTAKSFQVVSPSDTYLPNWHIDVIADHLTQAARGDIKRLIITMPPRSMKSISASIALPAWVLGHDPSRRIICASYSTDLAAKFARDTRSVMDSAWYRETFPHTRLKRSAELDLETTRKGVRYATSVGGTLTGRGGSLIIIDDPLKPQDAMSEASRNAVKQWYDGTLYSRLDNKANDVIILVMQRLHMDDLVARVVEKEDWVRVDLPAIAECYQEFQLSDGRYVTREAGAVLHDAREPKAILEDVERTIGSFNFAAQYQQQPAPEAGNLIKWQWFQWYDEQPRFDLADDRIVQSWDTASKATELSDYSVCTTWHIHGDDFYLLDVFRAKLDYPELRKAVIDQAWRFEPRNILIEDSASGTALIQDIQRERLDFIQGLQGISPKGDKVMRMSAQSAKIEAGLVYLPRKALWLDEFRKEFLAFPNSKHDDQVDSLSQFFYWIDERRRNQCTVQLLYL